MLDDDLSRDLFCAIKESCASCRSDLIALSGGLDSSILAYLLRDRNPSAVAVIAEDFVSTDLTYCQMASKELGIPLSIFNVSAGEILEAVEGTIGILKNFNDIEIRNNVVMYLAISWAKRNGMEGMVTGDGADELFAGYSFMVNKPEGELEGEIDRVCSVMHFPTQEIGKALEVRIESPFLDDRVRDVAGRVPASLKVRDDGRGRHGKWILRKTFEGHIPAKIAWRGKSPMQDGSGTAGLTQLFESIIEERGFVERKLTAEKEDGVIIRSRESMHYYETYRRMFGVPPQADAGKGTCPYCRFRVNDSRFCRMCGAFPI